MKVVALAAEPSLAAALNMMEAWEVVYASEPEQAVQEISGARVVLVGGGTEEGLRLAEVLRSLGVTIPAVIIGDETAPGEARHPVIIPPFTLDGLRQVVEQAVADGKQSHAPQGSLQAAVASDIVPQPASVSTGKRVKHLSLAPNEEDSSTAEPTPKTPVAPVAPPSSDRLPSPQSPAASVAPVSEVAPRPQRPEVTQAVPARTDLGTPIDTAQPSPRVVPASPVRDRPRPTASPVPPEAVIIGPSAPKGGHGRGLLRRRPKTAEPVESSMSSQLRTAAEAITLIEEALEQLPVLADLRELTQALLGEVVELLQPQTAAIYLPGPDGYRVWASHRFSNVERTMAVQTHQPLFADLLVRHEAMLIEPVDLAQTLVAGVGGARTNAFLASPIESNQKCVGIIVAGRDHFENEDLERLESLAEEAAAGLAVALGLDRLRTGLV